MRRSPARLRPATLGVLLLALRLLLLPAAAAVAPPRSVPAAPRALNGSSGSGSSSPAAPALPSEPLAGNRSAATPRSPVAELLRDLPALKAAVVGACAASLGLIACLLFRVFRCVAAGGGGSTRARARPSRGGPPPLRAFRPARRGLAGRGAGLLLRRPPPFSRDAPRGDRRREARQVGAGWRLSPKPAIPGPACAAGAGRTGPGARLRSGCRGAPCARRGSLGRSPGQVRTRRPLAATRPGAAFEGFWARRASPRAAERSVEAAGGRPKIQGPPRAPSSLLPSEGTGALCGAGGGDSGARCAPLRPPWLRACGCQTCSGPRGRQGLGPPRRVLALGLSAPPP